MSLKQDGKRVKITYETVLGPVEALCNSCSRVLPVWTVFRHENPEVEIKISGAKGHTAT